MLDQQHRHLTRQCPHCREDVVALAFRHAGRGLVEQQHARSRGESNRDLEQPLPSIRQVDRLLAEHVAEVKTSRDLGHLV